MSAMHDKIRALLAKAQGTDNEHEAAAFLTKAQQLLEQHQLDLNDVLGHDDPILWAALTFSAKDFSWKRRLYYAVAVLYGARAVMVKMGTDVRVELAGRQSALATVEVMWPYIQAEVQRVSKRLAPSHGLTAVAMANRVGIALIIRAQALAKSSTDAPRTDVARQNALATVDLVEAAFNAKFPTTSLTKHPSIRLSDAARAAAAGIGLHAQVGGGSTLRLGRG